MNKQQFIQHLQNLDLSEDIKNLVFDLCSKKTVNPPGNENLCNKTLFNWFQKLGGQIDVYEKESGRTNIVCKIKGDLEGKTIAIVGHTDVVPVDGQDWQSDPFLPEFKDGKIYARGAADNKGPFAATICALATFLNSVGTNFAGEILLISTADEEQGSSLGIKYLIEEYGLKMDYALIPDGGEFSELIIGEMGILTLNFVSKGKAYHGSMPEKGQNALLPLAQLATLLGKYDWTGLKSTSDWFDHAVLNIGKMSAGTADNIVPDIANLSAMWRYPIGVDAEQVEVIVNSLIEKVRKDFDFANIHFERKHISFPFLSPDNGKLVQIAMETAKDLYIKSPAPKAIRAETVAKYIYQKCDAEVIVNGPEDGSTERMHQPNEYISLESLNQFAKYYANLVYNLTKN